MSSGIHLYMASLIAAILTATIAHSADDGVLRDRDSVTEMYESLASSMSPAEAFDTLVSSMIELDNADFQNSKFGEAPKMRAWDDPSEQVMLACEITTNMPTDLCFCVAAKASEDLSADGQILLTAVILGDKAAVERRRGQVSIDEFMLAGTYMAKKPAECAN